MSEIAVGQAVMGSEGGLGQAERVVDAFVAPTKVFEDIKRGNASWWLPWLLSALMGLGFAYVVLHRIGIQTLVEGVIQQSAVLQEQITNDTPEQAAALRNGMAMRFQYMYVAPAIFLVVGAIVAAILLGTANFVFGGRATYKQMLAVWFYGTLPLTLISVLAVVSLYAGGAEDSFNIRNTVGTNVGYWVMGGGAPVWLVTVLSSVDVIAIWAAVLLTIGVSRVAGIKRGQAVDGGVWVVGDLCGDSGWRLRLLRGRFLGIRDQGSGIGDQGSGADGDLIV